MLKLLRANPRFHRENEHYAQKKNYTEVRWILSALGGNLKYPF
jgi:hypothetical protein